MLTKGQLLPQVEQTALMFAFIAYIMALLVLRKQQLELDMQQQTGSKSGKEDVKAVYCHPAYLTSMQSTS